MKDKYSVQIIWSEEDNGFIGVSPEWPGLSVFGETRTEVIENFEIVLKDFIEWCLVFEEPLPKHLT